MFYYLLQRKINIVFSWFVQVKGPFYDVPTGRRDGRLSKMSLADKLPDVDDSINVLKSKFREKGLSDKDLVLLSGGMFLMA